MNLPPAWDELAKIREALGRIEATIGFIDQNTKLNASKLETTDLRLYALEQGKLANAASAAAAMGVANTAVKSIEAYDISPSQFHAWKVKVDQVVDAFANSQLAISVRQNMRKQDFAALAMIAGLCGTIVGMLPTVINLITGG